MSSHRQQLHWVMLAEFLMNCALDAYKMNLDHSLSVGSKHTSTMLRIVYSFTLTAISVY